MARFVTAQTNFTTGEIDPLLRSRIDLKAYENALSEATNVVCQPQGGVTRRKGTRYINTLPNTGAESAVNGVRLVPFEFSTSDSYMLCFTHQRMYVYKNGSLITNINGSGNPYYNLSFLSATPITGTVVSKMCWTQSADTLILVQEDMAPVRIVRGGTDASWTASYITFDSYPKYPFTIAYSNPAGTLTPSAISGKVTLTASSGVFSAGSVGQYVNVSPQGRAKIVEYTSSTVVKAITDFPFFNTDAIPNGLWEYESGYEPVWSNSRGYPRTATFHEGRLYFGGSKSRPSTIWGSKVGLFLDFEATEGLDDDSVEATLDTNTFNAITDMISGRDLQIFTTGGEFYVQQSTTDPITPTNFFVKTVSRHGSKAGVRIQPLESGTLFIQRQGKALNEFAFSDTQLTYLTNKISLLSGHLLNNPKTMSLRKSVNTDENDLLMVVNADDGTIAAYSLLKAENIIAASKWTTVGSFVDVGVDIQTIYTVVKRTISGVDQYYVERFDDVLLTDSAVTGGVSSTASVSHLVGKSVNILLDDIVQANQTVPGGGTVTFSRASTADYEVGLPISVSVKTMPADIKIQTGTRLGFKKRIVEVHALVLETQNLVINGIEVPFRSFDTIGTLDTAIPEYTGTKVLHGILGYSADAKLTITQSAPLKFTLLGMEYKLSVHQGT
jgi:hypothetical protein